MFASNFTILDSSLKYVRGEDKIKTFAMTKTIKSGNTMTNYFCGDCGSLMYRGTYLAYLLCAESLGEYGLIV